MHLTTLSTNRYLQNNAMNITNLEGASPPIQPCYDRHQSEWMCKTQKEHVLAELSTCHSTSHERQEAHFQCIIWTWYRRHNNMSDEAIGMQEVLQTMGNSS